MNNRHKSLYDYGFPQSYSVTSKTDVFNFLQGLNTGSLRLFLTNTDTHCLFKKFFPELFSEFLKFNVELPFGQKLWHFLQDDLEMKLGYCQTTGCSNRCAFKSFKDGYYNHCSLSCTQLDEKIQNKIRNTNLEKYGVEHAAQNEDIKRKTEKSNIEKYGVKSPSQLNEVKSKIRNTNLEKYGVDNYAKTLECLNKAKKTNIERYGVDNYSKTNFFSMKYEDTMMKKYGVKHYSQTDEYKLKCEQTNLEKYGEKYYRNFNKARKTCKEKYGVEYYTQTPEFAKFHKKRVEYDGLTFDSFWEVIVYQYCQKNNLSCEYQPKIRYKYEYAGKKHYYQPDFLIDGKIYEVKGDQFFDGDKMICPFNRKLDIREEAKHQCMISNNVIILRGDDIKKMRDLL